MMQKEVHTMRKASRTQIEKPDRILSYFRAETVSLAIVTASGLFYNVGLLAGPWFEGKLAQCLLDIFSGKSSFIAMAKLAIAYVAVTAAVQAARYVKRFYVRRFANNVNRSMKHVLYKNLVHMGKADLEQENVGSMMTKAISDVDACAEGMRKFTTEIFDTGVALLGYALLLLYYDWRLALLSLLFPPFAYLIAQRMKTVVQRTGAASKESAEALNSATMDRASHALTYRVFGCEEQRNADYEKHLEDYEKKAVWANIWVSAMPPLYQVISMISVLFILHFGSQNVLGQGWAAWDIAAFTTFLSCFSKLAVKSSKAAKLFNSVQKAQVSWKRIKPLMKDVPEDASLPKQSGVQNGVLGSAELRVNSLGFAYPGGKWIFRDFQLAAGPGQIIGITGPVACGKSTLGKTFLAEHPYHGSIEVDGQELWKLPPKMQRQLVGYLGHDPEIMSCSIRENICLGDDVDIWDFLDAAELSKEVKEMPQGADTLVGDGGVRLSGGQQQRLALARTLAHPRPLMILDDPFSALDTDTEEKVFRHLKELAADRIVILISHRLHLFPQMDQVVWMEDGHTATSTHEKLMKENKEYRALYLTQAGADAGLSQKQTGSSEGREVR